MADPTGDHLIGVTIAGKYAVRRLLGVGGFGAVYEGVHTEIGKRVAVKVISGALADLPEVAIRFRRKARAASAVESDHIVQVFDAGQDPVAGLFMVMEFLQGEDLSKQLEREQRVPVDRAIDIGTQIARALVRAHEAGVVHRDMKPANVFICDRGDGPSLVKVLDFGISKLLNEEKEAHSDSMSSLKLTRVGTVMGTPQYMSPEQAQGLATVDARSDLWSLGAILYEMLAGVPAYELMATYEQTIVNIVINAPPPLHERAPWVPLPLSHLVHECLTRDLDKRIPDAATLLRRLREATGAGLSSVAGGAPRTATPRYVSVPNFGSGSVPAAAEAQQAAVTPVPFNGGATMQFDPSAALASGVHPHAARALPTSASVSLEAPAEGSQERLVFPTSNSDLPPAARPRANRGLIAVLAVLALGGAIVATAAMKQDKVERRDAVPASPNVPVTPRAPTESAGTTPSEEVPPNEALQGTAVRDAGLAREEAPKPAPSPVPARPLDGKRPGPPTPTAPSSYAPTPTRPAAERPIGAPGHAEEF